jgi:two-component system OmpR family response regulator
VRILVIEDSPPTRDLLRRSLAEAGHSVVLASRSATGERLALEESFDAIILDVMLPDGSGIDLCRALRAGGATTPILFLTARNEVLARIEGLDAGADDYLPKPFALAELHARLRALGRRRAATPPARLERGDVRIDFSARRLERGGADIPITAREWAVLEILVARGGRIVTREELLDLAWPGAGAGASESLDVIVSRLRKKLGPRGAGDWIRTVRGEGYVFEDAL